jgi:hypothetical protein
MCVYVLLRKVRREVVWYESEGGMKSRGVVCEKKQEERSSFIEGRIYSRINARVGFNGEI